MRTAFQRDRDWIIHCKAFRRLKHKTQVFIAPLGDHYVTRLTHTLEVSQIARTIARALNLNEDLTEAVALGHDLGHTPFGHVGEDVLNELYHGGFRHNEQSLRIVDLLEKDGQGLNLTREVRDGIINHSKTGAGIYGEDWGRAGTLEGEVVVSGDTARREAARFGWTPGDELLLYVIHGTLHLVGFRDATPDQQAEMRQQERVCLSHVGVQLRHEDLGSPSAGTAEGKSKIP